MKAIRRCLTWACLFAVPGLGLSAANGQAPKPDQELIQGAWVCVGVVQDGKPAANYVGVWAVMAADNLTWYFPQQDGSYREQKNKFRINPASSSKHYDWWVADKTEASADLRLYSLTGDVLRWSTNLDYKTRPATIESGRWQFTMVRIRKAQGAPIAGWGAPVDPDGDCTILAAAGKLNMRLPASQHDLHFADVDPTKRFNAPRVLQEVEGDFVAQVKVSADWTLGPALPNGRNFTAAGLLVWNTENQYFRHERNVYIPPSQPGKVYYYQPPLYDSGGQRVTPFKGSQTELFQGRSTWLRIERTGPTLTASISHDGAQWTPAGTVTTEFPAKVRVGVVALNGSARELAVEFEDLRISKK